MHQDGKFRASEITPEAVWQSRRTWLQAAASSLTLALPGAAWADQAAPQGTRLQAAPNPGLSVGDDPNSWEDITTYNNFYEFGTGKGDPAQNAGQMHLDPWQVRIDGAVRKPMTLDIDALRRLAPLEDRIYRLRCVEAWSMVIPWVGYSLSHLLQHVEPTADARYVVFTTAVQREAMPGVQSRILDWPYTEGLRMDEAM
ncbi:MAG TPA: protein-methionine-sulfoxide reductase catalytic subunit MsrP, partial [Castellaniella sp.]|nr:protein-methionine-sulfoxide reductase catalytic subunit MsrP [Castellaniella sp.]